MFPESNRAGLITALHIITCFAFTAGGQSRPPRRLHMQLRLRERNLQEKRRADINILFECGVKTNLDRIRKSGIAFFDAAFTCYFASLAFSSSGVRCSSRASRNRYSAAEQHKPTMNPIQKP